MFVVGVVLEIVVVWCATSMDIEMGGIVLVLG